MTTNDSGDGKSDGRIDYKNPETLRRLYWGEGNGLQEVADMAGVSVDTIWRWMDKHGIERRRSGPSDKKKPDGDVDHTDPDTLRRLYHDEGLSQPEIAKKADVRKQTIAHHMERNGIERRDRIEATREASRREYAHRYMSSQGYINYEDTWKGDGSVFGLHRLLAIAEYGFEAIQGKHVHHENNIPWDNRPENIELLTPSEHTRHHQLNGDLEGGTD